MYICICNAIKESDLREAARTCSGNAETAYESLGKKPNCGQCLVKANSILQAERCELVAL